MLARCAPPPISSRSSRPSCARARAPLHALGNPPPPLLPRAQGKYNQSAEPNAGNDLAQIRALGFDVVRLGVSWSLLEPAPGVPSTEYLDRIAQARQTRVHRLSSALRLSQRRSTDPEESAWQSRTRALRRLSSPSLRLSPSKMATHAEIRCFTLLIHDVSSADESAVTHVPAPGRFVMMVATDRRVGARAGRARAARPPRGRPPPITPSSGAMTTRVARLARTSPLFRLKREREPPPRWPPVNGARALVLTTLPPRGHRPALDDPRPQLVRSRTGTRSRSRTARGSAATPTARRRGLCSTRRSRRPLRRGSGARSTRSALTGASPRRSRPSSTMPTRATGWGCRRVM